MGENMSQLPEHPRPNTGLNDTGIIWLCYILYALTPFLGGVPAVVAVIINYIKRTDARSGDGDALLRNHMQWQIATFWTSVILIAAAALVSMLLFMTGFGAILIFPLWIALLIWYAYRIIKGMLAINNGRAVA